MEPVDRPWRLFVAVAIGDGLRAELSQAVAVLRGLPGADGWRWSQPDGWHVTLAFLGGTDASAVPSVVARLRTAVDGGTSFAVTTGGLGAFPSPGRARVLWHGVADPTGDLRRLAGAVQTALGLEVGAPFRGHLTLARARDRYGTDARRLLGAPMPDGRIQVDEAVLYRSHVGRGPARHEPITRVAVSTPAGMAV